MQGNAAPDTGPEARLRSALHRTGLRFRKHVRPAASVRCRPDVVFPTEHVAVFVDGCFWRGCPEHFRPPSTNSEYWDPKIALNQARDRRNEEALAAAGWTVIRVWEHEEPEAAAQRVRSQVVKRRT
jgi:DNA mismatch endonuclease, patch repair protein